MLLTIQITFFSFVLSFLKVCFHTILNKSKNIVFTTTPPPPRCLVCAFDWVQASISSFFNALFPIRRQSFLWHMQVPLFWTTVFVNILQLSFSMYFFLIVKLLFLFIYRGTLPCEHPVYTTTSCLSSPPIVFPPRRENHVISYVYFVEGWLRIIPSVTIRSKGRWGDRSQCFNHKRRCRSEKLTTTLHF